MKRNSKNIIIIVAILFVCLYSGSVLMGQVLEDRAVNVNELGDVRIFYGIYGVNEIFEDDTIVIDSTLTNTLHVNLNCFDIGSIDNPLDDIPDEYIDEWKIDIVDIYGKVWMTTYVDEIGTYANKIIYIQWRVSNSQDLADGVYQVAFSGLVEQREDYNIYLTGRSFRFFVEGGSGQPHMTDITPLPDKNVVTGESVTTRWSYLCDYDTSWSITLDDVLVTSGTGKGAELENPTYTFTPLTAGDYVLKLTVEINGDFADDDAVLYTAYGNDVTPTTTTDTSTTTTTDTSTTTTNTEPVLDIAFSDIAIISGIGAIVVLFIVGRRK